MPEHASAPLSSPTDPASPSRRPPPDLVSIVVPVFDERANVERLADAVHEALGDQPYELIFVDDGSRDDTLRCVMKVQERRSEVVAIALSRNFGHQNALAAGLTHARGDVVVTMDGDLQHPPRLIPTLIDHWRDGSKIVYTQRHDTTVVPWFKRVTSRAYYRLFSLMCGVPIEPGMADFRLLDRAVVEEIRGMREGHLLFRALLVWMGFPSATVEFTVEPRYAGHTKYTLRKMLKLASDGLLSFSTIPLRISMWLGIVTAVLSFIELAFVVISWAITRTAPGWASTLTVTTFFFGVLFIILGIQGQYLLRLYEIGRRRPNFIVDRIIRAPQDETAS